MEEDFKTITEVIIITNGISTKKIVNMEIRKSFRYSTQFVQ